MRLSSASVHAVKAVVYLARTPGRGGAPSHEIAREYGLSEKFLLKVLGQLVRAGLVGSRKGPGGGYWLARGPADVTLLDVLEAVDDAAVARGGLPAAGPG